MAFPTLSVAAKSPAYLRAGFPVYLETKMPVTGDAYCAFPSIEAGAAGAFYNKATVDGTNITCEVPSGIQGESYAILTKSESISDAQTIAGPALLQVQAVYTYPGYPGVNRS